MKRIQSTITLFLFSLLAFSQSVIGDWTGTLSVGSQSLRLVFHITQTDDGYAATMDCPDQGAKGIAMSHVTFIDKVLTIELRVAGITFKGTPEGRTIKGTFTQAGKDFPLVLTKSDQENSSNTIGSEPGSSQGGTSVKASNADYEETPVQLNVDKGALKGTLTLPKGFKQGTLALIIAGSGPTDRDGNNPTMRCDTYKQLAPPGQGRYCFLRYATSEASPKAQPPWIVRTTPVRRLRERRQSLDPVGKKGSAVYKTGNYWTQ
jgi:hypothetical protein